MSSEKKKTKKVLVLGNGFDLDLGLKTTYKDFAKSDFFKKLYPFAIHDNLISSLVKQSSCNWFDIEECIAEYVKRKESTKDYSCVEEDKLFFNEFKQIFADYIQFNFTESPYININHDSIAHLIIQEQKERDIFNRIYSFNCFDYSLNDFVSYGGIGDLYVDYVHNKEGKFILGICEDDCTTDEYSFLIKKNQDYEKTNIVDDLKCADDIVIFGHSLNRIDKEYFQNLFLNSFWKKNITIITRNEESVKKIENNILMMGASLASVTNNGNLRFIETEKYDDYDRLEMAKVEDLFL